MKRVLITGANKGIGRALVAKVLEQGDDTFAILGSRDLGRGQEAKQQLLAEHPEWSERIWVLPLDVSDDASVAQAAQDVKAKFAEDAPLYGIINNAGIGLGADSLQLVLEVNVLGIHRVCSAFVPFLSTQGRVVNITSASGPNFVNQCGPDMQQFFLNKNITWAELESLVQESIGMSGNADAFEARGLGSGNAYGLSKALANSYTMLLARENPNLTINACTPGFIETDLTRPYAESSGRSPAEMGMKSPAEGTRSAIHLMFGNVEASGHYYGSDAQRSPLDRYRSPGDPPYKGD